MYFSYLLIFLEGIGLNPVEAGVVLIIGQLVDGAATPIVGFLSDRTTCITCRLGPCTIGRRKLFYALGLTCVTLAFGFVFSPEARMGPGPWSDNGTTGSGSTGVSSSTSKPTGQLPVVYFSIMNSIFQVGWASVQVSHMSMVPELSPELGERILLNSIRFAVTVVSSITVYIIFLLLESGMVSTVVPHVAPAGSGSLTTELQTAAYIVLAFGLCCGLAFILLVPEGGSDSVVDGEEDTLPEHLLTAHSNQGLSLHGEQYSVAALDGSGTAGDVPGLYGSLGVRNSSASLGGDSSGGGSGGGELPGGDSSGGGGGGGELPGIARSSGSTSICGWLSTPGFFSVMAVYMCTRLCVNTTQLYLPFYLLHTLGLPASAIAQVPLTVYTFSFISSTTVRRVAGAFPSLGQMFTYGVGTGCTAVAAVVLLFLDASTAPVVFLAAAALGFGSSQLMVTSQTLVAELVGSDTHGAVVFGAMSCVDKVSTGLCIYIIQNMTLEQGAGGLGELYRHALVFVPLVSCCLALASLVFAVPRHIKLRRLEEEADLAQAAGGEDAQPSYFPTITGLNSFTSGPAFQACGQSAFSSVQSHGRYSQVRLKSRSLHIYNNNQTMVETHNPAAAYSSAPVVSARRGETFT
jgi:Na+/melibiose symporter-like transporter